MKNVMCKGSWALGTACGRCQRCKDEVKMWIRVAGHMEVALKHMADEGSAYAKGILDDVKKIRGK